jgi:tetratricopeptide (TPR) repeat protein
LDSVSYKSARYFEWLGEYSLICGNVIDAIGHFDRSLRLFQDDEVRIRLAKLTYYIGEFDQCLKYLKDVNPLKKDTTLYRIDGICNFFKENFKESSKLLESVIMVEPNDVYALYFLGDIEERSGRTWKSDNYLSKIVSRSRYSTDERALAALAFLILNETSRADQYISINLREEPNHHFSIFVNGIIKLTEKKFHRCYESFKRLFEDDSYLLKREFKLIRKSLKKRLMDEFFNFLEGEDRELFNFFIKEIDENKLEGLNRKIENCHSAV